MGTNCAPLLADIFLYSYEAQFIQSLLSTGRKQLASRFNFTYRYIDDVLTLNNPEFENYLGQMYPVELEIKDTTESNTSAWIYFCRSGGMVDFKLPFMTNVTILISTSQIFRSWVAIFQPRPPMSPYFAAYTICQGLLLVWIFILRTTRLSNKLLEQGYFKEHLKSSLRKFYGRYGDLIKQYEVSLSQMLNEILWPDNIQWQHLLIRLCTELDLLPNFERLP